MCTVKFQERFPLRTLGADFIYINKNQKYGGGAHVWLLLRVCKRLVGLEWLRLGHPVLEERHSQA